MKSMWNMYQCPHHEMSATSPLSISKLDINLIKVPNFYNFKIQESNSLVLNIWNLNCTNTIYWRSKVQLTVLFILLSLLICIYILFLASLISPLFIFISLNVSIFIVSSKLQQRVVDRQEENGTRHTNYVMCLSHVFVMECNKT